MGIHKFRVKEGMLFYFSEIKCTVSTRKKKSGKEKKKTFAEA